MKYFTVLILLGFLISACGHHQHKAGNSSATAGDGPQVFACPMDCEKGKSYEQAGKCPVCGMALEAQAPAPAAEQPDNAWKTLSKEAEDIHDEAMKDMAEMNRVGRQVKDVMKRAKMTKETLDKYTAVLVAMDKAEADMMTWMTQYKEPENQTDESLRYLQEQKQKIEQNRSDIRAALEAGKKLVSQ